MDAKSPRPGKVQGLGSHRADDTQAYTATSDQSQLPTDTVEILPSIHVRRDGAFYRLQIFPPDALPQSMARPQTYGSHLSAMMTAKWLSLETGWPIVDLGKGS